MAIPVLSPMDGRFFLPNPIPANQTKWLESNFEHREMKLPRSPNCVAFKRSDLEDLCNNESVSSIGFSKVSLKRKGTLIEEISLGCVGVQGTTMLLGAGDKILFCNQLLTPKPSNVVLQSFKEGTPINFIRGKPLKSVEFKMPETQGQAFDTVIQRLQDFDNHKNLNYSLTVTYADNDFAHFWENKSCKSVAFYPILAEIELVRETEDRPRLFLEDHYTSLVETFLAVAADEEGNLLLDVEPVISPNAWPPRYIR